MKITKVCNNIEPGYIVTSQSPARYFLEVNAGEMARTEIGDATSVELLALQSESVVADWMAPVAAFARFVLLGALVVNAAKNLSEEVSSESTSRQRDITRDEAGTCEIVQPRHYSLMS